MYFFMDHQNIADLCAHDTIVNGNYPGNKVNCLMMF